MLRLSGSYARAAVAAVTCAGLCSCAQHGFGTLPDSTTYSSTSAAAACPQATPKVAFPSGLAYAMFSQPAVALKTPEDVVEEHHDGHGKLVYTLGRVVDNTVEWGRGDAYDTGSAPGIAVSGSTVVDVSERTSDKMQYHVGTVNGDKITWGKYDQYDTGYRPRVAFAGNNVVVEVHYSYRFGAIQKRLWYNVGTLNGQQIKFGGSDDYDWGYYPAVAANSNGTVIEVHAGYSDLWYHVGKVNVAEKKLVWQTPSVEIPGTGSSEAAIAWSPEGQIVLGYLHGGYLSTRMAKINANNRLEWYGESRALSPQNNAAVSIALNGNSAVAVMNTRPLSYAASRLTDRANWECAQLDKSLNGKALATIVFPGSHDAGMYRGNLGWTALNQDQTLYGQLSGGQRYFDLRPALNPVNYKGLYIYHGSQKRGWRQSLGRRFAKSSMTSRNT